jgi:ABC-2 type transport system ATP-binding protein
MNTSVLSIQNLAKQYGSIKALDGISYDVPKGCVFGILGPTVVEKPLHLELF